MLAIPKKKRVIAARSESVAEVLATQSSKANDLKAGRAAAAAGGEITTKSLQALLDKSMKNYLPDLPRMIVTGQPLSVFKKRIKAAEIKDIAGFIDYTVREWTTFAAQNRAARIKDPSKARKGDALPEAPNFTSLAYRLPYFIAAYSNNLVEGQAKEVKSAEQQEIERLKGKVAQAQRESMEKTELIRRISRRPVAKEAPAPAPRVTRPRQTVKVALEDDWVPPEWDGGPKARKGA